MAAALHEITFEKKDIDTPELFDALRKYGTVIVNSFYDQERVSGLNEEFERILACREPYLKKVEYSNGRATSFKTAELDRAAYPVTYRTYTDKFMQDMTTAYFN